MTLGPREASESNEPGPARADARVSAKRKQALQREARHGEGDSLCFGL